MWINYYFECFIVVILIHCCSHLILADKIRICTVDGKGIFRKAAQYCPILDSPDSMVECVVGIDRLDCLRRISKGKADFSVFMPEDILAALNMGIDVLITNELKYGNTREEEHQYEMVAVIYKYANINNAYDVKGKRFCHPGYGLSDDLSTILANYFEATNVSPSCDTGLSLVENRIKASSQFFEAACKAGPWVSDPQKDALLKSKYPNMCSLCDYPNQCSTRDKYWGRIGNLLCLTDGKGDIAWARLDDVESFFSLSSTRSKRANVFSEDFNFLCRDGTLMSLNSTKPCIWVAKPWPVVASRRGNALKVQSFIDSFVHSNLSAPWENALKELITIFHEEITTVIPMKSIDSYLSGIQGYLSANSFSGCHPLRTVRICTISNIENTKCHWLREASITFGVEPGIDCIKANNKTHCMKAVHDNYADVVFVEPDQQMTATRNFHLKTLLYEISKMNYLYTTVAVVKQSSNILNWEDLHEKKACFPTYDGIAWNTMLSDLKNISLLKNKCPYEKAIAEFFSSACVPNLANGPENLKKLCRHDLYNGEKGALRCVVENQADVAFIDLKTLEYYTDGKSQEVWAENLKLEDFRVLCVKKNKKCALSSMSYFQAMVKSDITSMQELEIMDTLLAIDKYFGKNVKSVTPAFTLYGSYDGQRNILFSDNADKLDSEMHYKNFYDEDLPPNYNDIVHELLVCKSNNDESSSESLQKNNVLIVLLISLILFVT